MESPFKDKIFTNYSPSTQEAREIERFCTEPSERLQKLDDDIKRLEGEREKLNTFIHGHKMLLSPIRRLSVEVLQSIFMECLPTERYPSPHTSRSYHFLEAPILLGQVCRDWRRISHADPCLWRSITIFIPTYSQPDPAKDLTSRRIGAMQIWISRSGSLPLNISMVLQNIVTPPMVHGAFQIRAGRVSREESQRQDVAAFAEALLPYSHRWGSLDIRLPTSLLQPFSKISSADVPLIRSISIPTPSYLSSQEKALAFLNGAGLTHVTFKISSMNQLPVFNKDILVSLNISCKDIRIPTMGPPDPAIVIMDGPAIVRLLIDCCRLKVFRFAFEGGYTSVLPQWTQGIGQLNQLQNAGVGQGGVQLVPVLGPNTALNQVTTILPGSPSENSFTLPSLEVLEFKISRRSGTEMNFDYLWRSLYTPKLNSLIFAPAFGRPTSTGSHNVFVQSLKAFIERSPSLQSVEIRTWNDKLELPLLDELLSCCPQITSLKTTYDARGAMRRDIWMPWGEEDIIHSRGCDTSDINVYGEELLSLLFLGPNGHLLPKLKRLSLDSCFSTTKRDVLHQALKAKIRDANDQMDISPLERITFDFSDVHVHYLKYTAEDLDYLKEAGIEVSVLLPQVMKEMDEKMMRAQIQEIKDGLIRNLGELDPFLA